MGQGHLDNGQGKVRDLRWQSQVIITRAAHLQRSNFTPYSCFSCLFPVCEAICKFLNRSYLVTQFYEGVLRPLLFRHYVCFDSVCACDLASLRMRPSPSCNKSLLRALLVIRPFEFDLPWSKSFCWYSRVGFFMWLKFFICIYLRTLVVIRWVYYGQ